ncbi:UPF0688 protein C1orf174 homolog isoform X2 [Pygocentrus nattereri]|uniref:UPF0688 protein C1orf174 homolog isoform X2 n=1 Tax=Pygocentrus nattereri TaxID=42514 RepID=UPI000814224A|nr:UPF0688 protein C1orf174 homolog isoform X2 [Pygocentrus nattereri]
MRTKQGYGNRREERTVSLNRLGVKSSSEHCVKRRALRGLRAVGGTEGRRQQMAGESGGRKRLPKRPVHGGGGEEKLTGNLSDSVKTEAGLMAPKEPRGKENSAGKSNPAAGKGKMKMEDAAVSGAAAQTDLSVFFDEDSNHIFPVEQFFGNLDSVQDFSRKATSTEGMSRREYRRRHYYAKEDSDEEQT